LFHWSFEAAGLGFSKRPIWNFTRRTLATASLTVEMGIVLLLTRSGMERKLKEPPPIYVSCQYEVVGEESRVTYLDIISSSQTLLSNTSIIIDTTSQEVLKQAISSASITRDKILVPYTTKSVIQHLNNLEHSKTYPIHFSKSPSMW
jgi:hypothetical protein